MYLHQLKFLLLSLVLLFAGNPGYSTAQTAPTKQSDVPVKIYSVIHGSPGDPFWAVYRKGLADAARDFNVELTDLGPTKFSIQEHVELLNSTIAARPQGIISSVVNVDANDEPLRRAISSGIPVIAVNVKDPRPVGERIPYLFYIGTDNELAGRAVAQRIVDTKKPKRAVCTISEAGNLTTELRCRGATSVFAENGIETDKLLTGTNPTQVGEILKGYFASQPDTEALVLSGVPNTQPGLQALEEAGLASKVAMGTFDLSGPILEGIKANKILVSVAQQQYLQGYLAVQFLALNIRYGFSSASDVLTGPTILDSTNIDRFIAAVKDGYS